MVSVIIPAYNAARTIEKTLDSVFAQIYQNLEVIVINDGSTDATANIVSSYREEVKLISTTNQGVSHARNLGFSNSKGDYIQYLDADDLLTSDKLFIQLKALQENNADVAYGDWQKFQVKNNQCVITESITRNIEGDVELALFTDFWCPPAALLYSRKICVQLKWNENLPIIQDARYFLDAAIAKGKFIYTPGIMAKYRTDQSSSLSQKSEKKFITDCYHNTLDIYNIWINDFQKYPQKRDSIINSLRFCINRLSVLDKALASQAIDFLQKIEPYYLPPEKGILRTLSKLIGYKNAELIASYKRFIIK